MVRCMEILLYDIASRFVYNYVIVHSNEYTHTNARTCGMMRSSLTYIRFSVLTPRSSGNSGTSDWRTCAATMGAGWVCASWQKAPSCDLEEITLSGGQGTRKQKCNPDNSRPLLPTARARCALATYSPEPTHQFNKLPNLKSFRNLFGSDFRWVGCCGCGWRQVCLQKLAKKVRTQKSKLKYRVKLYYHIQNPKLQGLVEFTTILRL